MSESKIINAIRRLHRTLFNILIFILLLFTFLLIVLDHGVKLSSINTSIFKAKQVYIKWDKKLTLRINSLDIKDFNSDNEQSFELEVIKELLQLSVLLFHEIGVNNLTYLNNSVTFSYINGNFHLDTPDFNIKSKIDIEHGRLLARIDTMNIKQYGSSIKGSLAYDHKSGQSFFNGTYSIKNEINGTINLKQYKNDVYLKADSEKFKSLEILQDLFKYSDNLNKWVGVRSNAEYFKIETLRWHINLSHPKKILKNLYAKIRAEKLQYRFLTQLPPVISTSTNLIFKDEKLLLQLNNPTYQKRSLDGSYLLFEDFLNEPLMTITLFTQSPLDETMLEILKNYDIFIPLTQLTGSLDTNLKLYVNLSGKSEALALGEFRVKDSNFLFDNFAFHANEALFNLNGQMLSVKDGNISIEPYMNITLGGELDTLTKSGKFNLLLNSSNIEVLGHNLIKNIQIPLTLEINHFHDTQYFYIEEIRSEIAYKDKKYDITLSDLQALYPYSPALRFYNIEFGNIRLQTEDFTNSKFYGEVFHNANLFLRNDTAKYFYKFDGNTSNDGLEISIEDDISLTIKDTIELNVKNFDVNMKALQKYRSKQTPFSRPIIVHTENSSIYIDKKHKILSDTLKINFDENISKVTLQHNVGNIRIESNASVIKVKGSNLDDDFVKALSGFNNFENGNFKFESEGNTTHYTTNIDFKDVTIRNLALYNNLIAFINTVPALLTFSEPGFNDKGYFIKNGHVAFRRIDDFIIIDDFQVNGINTNAHAQGVINLKNETLDILLSLYTIKDLAKTIGAVPIAGYLILGDDKTIRTRVQISGSIKNPKIQSKMGKDILEAPINIIKRTFGLPKKLLEFLK